MIYKKGHLEKAIALVGGGDGVVRGRWKRKVGFTRGFLFVFFCLFVWLVGWFGLVPSSPRNRATLCSSDCPGTHYVDHQAGLELHLLLTPSLFECWDFRCVPPLCVKVVFLKEIIVAVTAWLGSAH